MNHQCNVQSEQRNKTVRWTVADLLSLSYAFTPRHLVITIDTACFSSTLLISSLYYVCCYIFPEGSWYVNSTSLGLLPRRRTASPYMHYTAMKHCSCIHFPQQLHQKGSHTLEWEPFIYSSWRQGHILKQKRKVFKKNSSLWYEKDKSFQNLLSAFLI